MSMKTLSFQPPPSPPGPASRRTLTSIENRLSLSPSNRAIRLNQQGSSKSVNEKLVKPSVATLPVYISGSEEDEESGSQEQLEDAESQEQRDVAMELVNSSSTGTLGRAAMALDQQSTSRKSRRDGRRKRLAPLHIEVALKPTRGAATTRTDHVKRAVNSFLVDNFDSVIPNTNLSEWEEIDILKKYVSSIWVAESSLSEEVVHLNHVKLHIHVYCPSRAYIIDSFSAAPPSLDDDQDEDGGGVGGEDSDVMSATVAQLPTTELEGIWENLIYEDDVKVRLLNYIYSTQLFGDRQVDFNVISWHRVLLLHGPPGTGKTSLCRALAQKLAIRLSDRYQQGKLVEINSHSIMSKWFSESGKLVQRLFTNVLELVADESCFVVVLIDEVESLTSARAGAMSGKEPSDAVRVVNALLTQLDKLKNKKNVLVMTTSNLSHAIDPAFIDRADIKQYIGLPPVQAVYWILLGCLRELMRSRVIRASTLLDWKHLATVDTYPDETVSRSAVRDSKKLKELAVLCHGMSGRTLRRVPVLAHARYIAAGGFEYDEEDEMDDQDEESDEEGEDEEEDGEENTESLATWLHAMMLTAKAEKEQLSLVEQEQ